MGLCHHMEHLILIVAREKDNLLIGQCCVYMDITSVISQEVVILLSVKQLDKGV